MMDKKEVKKMMVQKSEVKDMKPHHSGKGTKARLNTAAEKIIFNSKTSK
jgi:hypothetical protein